MANCEGESTPGSYENFREIKAVAVEAPVKPVPDKWWETVGPIATQIELKQGVETKLSKEPANLSKEPTKEPAIEPRLRGGGLGQ